MIKGATFKGKTIEVNVGCLKITEDKASKYGPQAKREGRVSTLNADLALHQQNARVAFFIKHEGHVASSNADLEQGRVSDFKRKSVKLCVSKQVQACKLNVQTPQWAPHPNARPAFLL